MLKREVAHDFFLAFVFASGSEKVAHDEMLKREDLWKELKRQLSDLSGFLVGLIALGLVQVVGPLGFSLDCDPHRCLRLLGLGVPTISPGLGRTQPR